MTCLRLFLCAAFLASCSSPSEPSKLPSNQPKSKRSKANKKRKKQKKKTRRRNVGRQKGGKAIAPTAELSLGGNERIEGFAKAKRAMVKVFRDRRTTFYCGCQFQDDGRVDWASCGYVPRANSKRARRIEWEHVVPAHAFGQSFPSWRLGHPSCVNSKGKAYKGRRCARKVSPLFRRMESDLFNLQPAIGEVNADRSNYSMAELEGEDREYGKCDVEIRERKVEPRPSIRGDIARTYLYMDTVYPGRGIIGTKRRKLFDAWAKADPVDAWERTRIRRIEKVQGNRNSIVP